MNVDDPMFTTKSLNCASCAKGVVNMAGFRAEHISWANFPVKSGIMFSKRSLGF